jgi:hypothetical protein
MTIRRFSLLVTVLALVAAACGGSDEPAATTAAPTTAAPTTAAPDTAAPTTAAPTTAAPTTAAPDTTAGGGGGSGVPAAFREALSRTSDATSGRMEGSIAMSGIPDLPGGEFTIPFSGAFDNAAGTFAFTMDLSAVAQATGEEIPPGFEDMFGDMEIRQIGDVAYMRFPLFGMLGVQTEWLKMPADDSAATAGGLAGATPGNPADLLEMLEDADAQVEEIGRETIRGTETTHFRVTFDMEKLLEAATPEERAELEAQGPLPIDALPMDIWIGNDGLVHRYAIDIDGTAIEAEPGESFDRMTMTFDMFDFGADVNITAPPDDQVTDVDTLDFFDPGLFGP